MVVVKVVHPPSQQAGRAAVSKGGLNQVLHRRSVLPVEYEERRLTQVFVADGYLTGHDVGQGVDKYRRTGEEIVWVTDGRLIMSVSLYGSAAVEEHDGARNALPPGLSAIALRRGTPVC